jgi:protein-disulfide isomerase
MLRFALALGLCAALGCGPTREEIQELRDGQKQILDKLAALEQKIGAARTGGSARAPEDYDRVYAIPLDGAPIRGRQDAPVTIVEFSDFQCPFCARSQPMLEQALAKYPERVRLVYKHFPLSFHPVAMPAAVASAAAQEQGKFWELHDVLFEQGQNLTTERFDDYAKQAGLDVERFRKDLTEKHAEYERRVQQDYRHGLEADVRGTPTIYVNGKKLRERSLEGLSGQVDAELGKSG